MGNHAVSSGMDCLSSLILEATSCIQVQHSNFPDPALINAVGRDRIAGSAAYRIPPLHRDKSRLFEKIQVR
jgi:hypothetical protein